MGRPTKRKIDARSPMQRLYDAKKASEDQSMMDVITPEQRAKGTYEGERRIVNRGGTPVMRWIAAGKLTETQELAIQTCYRLWALVGLEQRTTAAYGESIQGGSAESERRTTMLIEAREDLYRIMGYIPKTYWQCFENVVRFDEPAGVAGSKLGTGRGSEDRAHTIVCFVADLIAMHERLVPVVRILVA
jgi:hypothetical protein